ncbi:MAG: sialate O-acetylesterase [Bacteroidales bacterium]|nr:sialate O-acetylesterase [Bacteroidales bacterium]
MKAYFISIIVSIVFSGFINMYSSTTYTLSPTDDTYIGGATTTGTNFGWENTFKTYFFSSQTNSASRVAYIKFDIRGISSYLDSVKLRLYTPGFGSGGGAIHKFNIYPVTKNSWAEDGLTYNNYTTIVGAQNTTILASYSVAAGVALSAGYIEFSDPVLTKIVADSIAKGCEYISFRLAESNMVKVGTVAQIVDFQSKENSNGPQLRIVEKNVEPYRASDIQSDAASLTGFTESTYRYVVRLPYTATTIPTITATPKYPATTVATITPATSLTGTEATRTTKVTMNSGGIDQLVYSVVFELLPSPTDAQLSNLTVDGKALEFFDKTRLTYTFYVPYSATSIPLITPTLNDPSATYNMVAATSLSSSASQSDRTTVITVTSANGLVSKIYSVEFIQLPKLDIILAIGQSNMSGRAPFADVTASMENIYLLTPEAEMEIASNPMNKYSNIRKDLSLQGLSPAYTCALALRDSFTSPFGFVVNSQGGSAIDLWYKPTKANYDATLIRAKQAQRFGTIRAIIWHQGEADRVAGLAETPVFTTYKSKLAQMVANFRADLNEPGLYFVAGELYSGVGTEHTTFNTEVIRNVGSIVTNSDYVTTENLLRLSDNLHFDEPSVKLFGSRYADKLVLKLNGVITSSSEQKIEEPLLTSTNGYLNIHNSNSNTTFHLFDVMGRFIEQFKLAPTQLIQIPAEKGVYIIKYSQRNNYKTIKLIVQGNHRN